MSRAIWVIAYALDDENRDDYLRWFHDVHIPEKLARPGYNWAGHYEIESLAFSHGVKPTDNKDEAAVSPLTSKRYLALFGGDTTQTFFKPGPSQLKGQQDDETRRMIGCRVNPAGFVFAEEWRAYGKDAQDMTAVPAPVIEFNLFNAKESDEDIGVWYSQLRRATFEQGNGCIVMQKLLASSGPARHGAMQSYASVEKLTAHLEQLQDGSDNHCEESGHKLPSSSTVLATRIWPQL